MMQDNKLLLSNGLAASIDWISFTVMQLNDVLDVIEFMGFSSNDFTEMLTGANGYKSRIQHNTQNIKILYDGANNDMGIHVDISGSAIAVLLATYKETLATITPFGKGYDL